MDVLHRCDNPLCCNPDHLFIGTVVDNARDRDCKGRNVNPRGEDHGLAVLTEERVLILRETREAGGNIAALARQWGISRSACWAAAVGRMWKHVGALRTRAVEVAP